MTHGSIIIDKERCKGCELCTTVCPQDVIVMDRAVLNSKGYLPAALLDPEGRCTGCAICSVICPDVCISVFREAHIPRRALSTA